MTKPKGPSPEVVDAVPGVLSTRWRDTFINTLAETSNISASAAAAGVTTGRVYAERRRNPDFLRRWGEALCEGYEHLEMEVLYRLRLRDEKEQQSAAKYDFGTALKLIQAHKETVARERALRGGRSEQEVLDSIDRMIDDMRNRGIANAAILAGEDDEDDDE